MVKFTMSSGVTAWVVTSISDQALRALAKKLARKMRNAERRRSKLLEADGAVSVIGLVDNAFRRVWAAAHRLGQDQTPVTFGHAEGALLLPHGVKGECCRAAFPERGAIHTPGDPQNLADRASGRRR